MEQYCVLHNVHYSAFDTCYECKSSEALGALEELQRRANNENSDGQRAKPSNPKDAVGSRKARWFSILPLRVLVNVGLAMLEGALKYGRHNYRIAGIRASVYLDAVVCGHLMPWQEGEDIDPDSGLNHIDKAIASLIVLRDGMLENNWVDDRAPSVENFGEFMAEAHKRCVALLEKYPEGVRKAAFTIEDTVWKKRAAAEARARLASVDMDSQPGPMRG
jgi:hypothetical protein